MKPSTNPAGLAPNPRQSNRGSCGFRRFPAAPRLIAHPATNPPNPAQPCGKPLRKAKNPGANKDAIFRVAGFQDQCIQPLCHPSGDGRRASEQMLRAERAVHGHRVIRPREVQLTSARLYTGAPDFGGEVAEWLKALAC